MGRWRKRLAKRKRGGAKRVHSLDPVRLAELVKGFEGHWVAIKDGEVKAVSQTPDGLHAKLVGDRIRDATILRVPDFDEPELVGFG